MKNKTALLFALFVAACVACAVFVPPVRGALLSSYDKLFSNPKALEAGSYYTCPMHPQIRMQAPGDCPICGMTLVKKEGGGAVASTGVQFTDRQVQQGGIRAGRIRKRALVKNVSAVGGIDYDERTLANVSARTDGRIDQLFMNFTGMTVNKGHVLASIYSPQLISAQKEYLLALETRSGSGSRSDMVESVKKRMLRWGVTEEQVAELEKTRKEQDHLTIYAPIHGTVIKRNVTEGAYVKEGDVLFEMADMSRVWLYADLYESDAAVLTVPHEGDHYECPMHPEIRSQGPSDCTVCGMALIRHSPALKAEITTMVYPGEKFEGEVEFTYPFVNPASRTIRVRITVPNDELKLRPQMYAKAELRVELGEKLSVPEGAVVYSGKRDIVFIDEGGGKFTPRAVKLGAMWLDDANAVASVDKSLPFYRGGQRYHEVLEGLAEGDLVVVSGNFVVDAESQLQGALDKIAREEETPKGGMPQPLAGFVEGVLPDYFALGKILSENQEQHFKHMAAPLSQKLAAGLSDDLKKAQPKFAERVPAIAEALGKASTPDDFRKCFEDLSTLFIESLRDFGGVVNGRKIRLIYCPMKKKYWLQESAAGILNPYAPDMPHCGEEREFK
jgi:Cu(I)/Ag(I) efflux system membrane fusion protein